MGGSLKEQAEQLNRTLNAHLNNIHETFQVLEDTPVSSCGKVNWIEVIKMGEQISRQATAVGMLWNGGRPKAKHLKENMETYFNFIQGFLFLAHGSKVGAGPTLSSCVDVAVNQVVQLSFNLFKDSLPLYESGCNDKNNKVPQLVGGVWEACSALKKVPTSNATAIGRAIAQVGVSVKDVLREMKEMKLDSGELMDENEDDDNNLGNDLTPEEMRVVESAMVVVSETIVVIKELIRSITGLVKRETDNNNNSQGTVECLEKLMNVCKEIGRQIDEVGACLFPPQEVSEIEAVVGKMFCCIDEMEAQMKEVGLEELSLSEALIRLRNSLKRLESDVGCSSVVELAKEVENLENKLGINNISGGGYHMGFPTAAAG